ncbi:amino acid adenylation domain-containing protein [Paenibacillus thiaminolyticus]|uniref:non-ribosomal peptide synthetase n=1 Tax=Paenibacillus thiaminolyticus TaxID=49283 RepID=UPI001163F761|nr:non-ribosomal peptide synthetase [Paenibacillus thiaminolyticus]NGP57204.1 amino acid adenylation domain-containing protein [Paenibacillus thiaminolyticus]
MNDSIVTAGLSRQDKERLIRQLLQQHQEKRDTMASYGQKAIWLLQQAHPDNCAYHMQAAWDLLTPVDEQELRLSFQSVYDTYSSLRTVFSLEDGEIKRRVRPDGEVDFRVHRLPSWGCEAEELFRRCMREPFSLHDGPLFRIFLFYAPDRPPRLLLSMHHIIADAWSIVMLLRDVANRYQHGVPVRERLQESRSYSAFVDWQQRYLQSERAEQDRNYWERTLAEPLPICALVADKVGGGASAYDHRGGNCIFRFSESLSQEVIRLSRKLGVTVNTLLLSSFAALLYRYTEQEEVVIGTFVSGRNEAGFEEVFGYLVNTVALRLQCSGELPFGKLADSVKRSMLGAMEHQDYPFPLVAERLQPERDDKISPVFQVAFVMERAQSGDGTRSPLFISDDQELTELGGMIWRPVPLETKDTPFELVLMVEETDAFIHGSFIYRSNLFSAHFMKTMARLYTELVEGVVRNPEERIGTLRLNARSGHGRRLQLPSAPLPHICLHHLLEYQATQRPESAAVTFMDDTVTYLELEHRANRIARWLSDKGVRKGDFVGVCLRRSPDMVAAVFAVLKLGAVFVPIDPAYPPQRIAYMANKVEMTVIISTSPIGLGSLGEGIELALLDWDEADIAGQSARPTGMDVGIRDLAYVIFTSGSTGKPKAVMIEHRGIWNMAEAQRQYFNLSDRSKVLQFASFSFDAWVFEVVMAFRSGGTLCMADRDTLMPGAAMARWMREKRISHAVLPPSVLTFIPDADLPELEVVISAGEPCTRDIVARWAPGRRFYNAYGPSEATVWVTVKECCSDDSIIDLGEAIPNVEVHVFNDYMQRPLPGGIGELYVGGIGLARGYCNDAELTQAKFIAPSAGDGHELGRLYRTGDLVRCLPDGRLQFVGRRDDQVKVRGVRLHLGEIESHLSERADIASCAVIVAGEAPDQASLVAFVVMKPQSAWEETAVREFLQERMPGHYIPSRFVVLGGMPLTPNGKVDRKALCSLLAEEAEEAYGMHNAPEANRLGSDMVEEVLIQIWKQVLGKKQVRPEEQFFEAGGHSLLATRLITAIHDVFGIELPIGTVFAKPALRDMASEIRRMLQTAEGGTDKADIVPLKLAGDYRAPLTSAQQRMWFLQKLDEDQTAYLLPGTLSLDGPLDVEALEQALQELIRRHDSLRTTIHQEGGIPFSLVREEKAFRLAIKTCTEEEAQQWIREECRHPIRVSDSELYRMTLLRTGERRHYLVLVLHHIITDGWSTGILLNELRQLYAIRVGQSRQTLPNPPLTYSDYARWEQEWIGSDSYCKQLQYWAGVLQQAIPPLLLPTDSPRTLASSYRGKQVSLKLPQALSEELKELGQRHNCTLFMTLFTVFNALLYRLSGTSDIAVGVPVANRHHRHVDQVAGLFVNTLLLRLDLSGNPDFNQLLLLARDAAINAYANQDMPFEKLVEMARPDRDLSRSSMFQVMFNMLNIPPVTAQFSGLTTQIIELDEPDSKCELTLYALEQAEGIQLTMTYASNLFREERATEMLAQFECLCRQIVNYPDWPIERYSLLTERSAAVLPDPGMPLRQARDPLLQPVHVMFRHKAAQCPEAIAAIDSDDAEYTYRDLDERSDRLAAKMIRFTRQRRGVIAIYGERSASLIVAMLAVLKSGSAFAVIDPAQPAIRATELLKASKADGIVFLGAERERPGGLLDEWARHVSFCIYGINSDYAADEEDSVRAMLAQLEKGCSLEDPAYVLFTSGTTGAPKGIQCTHEPLANFIRWQVNEFRLEWRDRFSMFSGLGHDPLLRDIFVPLSIGAAICIPDGSRMIIPEYVTEWMERRRITITHVTPAMGMVMAGGGSSGHKRRDLGAWRYAFFGGDVLMPSHIDNIRAIAPQVRCLNGYGATETPQIMGIYSVPADPGPSIPIGKGREGVQLLVMDSELGMKGIGETGEICIRSPYLASGYIGNAEAEQGRPVFVPNPYTSMEHDRIYRTGDLGRYLPDGNVEFIGRQGDFVKIRGYRVQLREIQEAILRHSAIADCLAVCQADRDDRIIAYVVPAERPFDPTGMQLYLRDRLPEYMLPAAYVELDQIPLTRNGKADAARLPEPGAFNFRESRQGTVLPETMLQRQIAEVWKRHLKVEEVGIHDNFFDAGGHSLLLLRVQQELEAEVARPIHVVDLFKYPTISLLAHYLEGNGNGTEAQRGVVVDEQRKSKQRAAQQAQRLRRKGERQ